MTTNVNSGTTNIYDTFKAFEHPHHSTNSVSTSTRSSLEIKKDEVSLNKKNEKISDKEALLLIGKGFKDKFIGLMKNIIQHPIKAISTMLLTSAALMALPFVGISVATGGAILAVGFGLGACIGTLINSCKLLKSLHKKDYDGARKNLYKLGSNSFDLALTLPFLPKAMRQINVNTCGINQKVIAYYKSTDGKLLSQLEKYWGGTKQIIYKADGSVSKVVKNSLLSQIKKAKTLKDKFAILFRQDKYEAVFGKINKAYLKTAQERGFMTPHDIQMISQPRIYYMKKGKIVGYEIQGGFVNTSRANVVNIDRGSLLYEHSVTDTIKKIGHEHRHVEQNSMMSRTEGLTDEFNSTWIEGASHHKDGIIKRGTEQAKLAEKFYKAHKNYVQPEKNYEAYKNNLLETDARNIGETTIAEQIMSNFKKLIGMAKDDKVKIKLKYNPANDTLLTNARVLDITSQNTNV